MTDAEIWARLTATPHLYKYWGSSPERHQWLRAALLESKLYFPSRMSFNDPLDCRIPLNFGGLSSIAVREFWRRRVPLMFPGEKLRDHRKRIERMVRLSRTAMGHDELSEDIFRVLDRQGIVCLSTLPDQMLMWSYYANGHAGVVLRLNLQPSTMDKIAGGFFIVPVQYLSDFPKIRYYKTDMRDLSHLMFGSKAKDWQHESEWRIILRNHIGNLKVPATLIDGVILGLRTSAEHEASIRNWIKQRSVPTELLRVRHLPESFELEVVPAG